MSDLLPGTVVKAWSNWYDVATAGGRLSCQPRGRLRRASALLVGDRVSVRPLKGGGGAIEGVEPRRNALDRPPAANVDVVAVVACWTAPPWSPELVDRVFVHASAAHCDGLLVMNKWDLLDAGEHRAAAAAVEPYRQADYPVLFTSAVTGEGLRDLRAAFEGRVLVLAGPSGVGKSSLLTALTGDAADRSGRLSERLGRGRHTTRHAELLPAGDGWVVDTPGFSRLGVEGMEPANLGGCFPDIAARAPTCRFRGCRHRDEPDCAVRGAIDPGRYARYLRLLQECERAARPVAQRSLRPRPAPDAWEQEDEDEFEDEFDLLDVDGVSLEIGDADGCDAGPTGGTRDGCGDPRDGGRGL